MQETQVWSLGWEDPLEKERATHYIIFAWEIPWAEKPGGLQSMRSQRVRHVWVTKQQHSLVVFFIFPFKNIGSYFPKRNKREVINTNIFISAFSNQSCFIYNQNFPLAKQQLFLGHGMLLQLCPILCDPMDGSPPGSSVHGILQTRILEWIAISSSRGSSQPRDWTCAPYVSFIAGRFFTTSAT